MIWEASTSNWAEAGLWDASDSVNILEYPFDTRDREWTCFDDLYLYPAYGIHRPAPPYDTKWRDRLQSFAGLRNEMNDSLECRCREGRLQ
eukprot:53352-Eustigmatos_ZCMA.PRE.1